MSSQEQGGQEFQKMIRKIVADTEEKKVKEQTQLWIDSMIEVHSALFDKAATYTTVVVSVGYVAFFTTWGFMKNEMSQVEMLVAGLSMGISVTIFIAWEVFNMIYTSLNLKLFADILSKPEPNFEKRWRRRSRSTGAGI